jgi:hypothetical protein
MAIFYINGTTLSNSTAIFTDAELTTCAADGFYSDGNIVREQVTCLLLPIVECPDCLAPCDTGPISQVGNSGIFSLDLDLGDTVSDIGAVIIKFVPVLVPDGIKATYNGVSYNKLSSDFDGYHGGTIANGYTYAGAVFSPAPCVPVAGTAYTLDKYTYNGTTFVSTGQTDVITPQSGELSFSAANPGNLYMVVPKTTASPQSINIEIVGACPDTAFGVEISCPALLTGYQSTGSAAPDSTTACTFAVNTTYYSAPVAGTPGVPEIFDWVFSDPYGEFVLPEGYYQITGNEWIQVDANGIVEDKGNC